MRTPGKIMKDSGMNPALMTNLQAIRRHFRPRFGSRLLEPDAAKLTQR
jgi:hypothetical protein